MLLKSLGKDLKRKKTMNIILLLFIILATMFVTIGALDPILEDEPAVENYRLENVIYAAEKNFTAQGEKVKTKNTVIIQSIGGSRIKFFDTDNREVTDITKGHAYVSGNFMEENHLDCGDTIRIQHGAVDMTLVLDGKVKDALLGSDMMGNSHGYWINLMGALLVVFVIVLFAYLCTGKVKKASPVDAIRSGQTGERYKKQSIYRIGKSYFSPSLYMAVNDIVSSTRRFLTIILSFSICTLLVLMIVNTTQTMKSPNLVKTFGTASDVYVTDVQEVMEYMSGHTKEDMEARLDELAEMLGKNGMPSEVCIELQYKYKLTFEGEVYNLTCQQGLHTHSTDYEYYEGEMPQNGNEIAITPQISELTGARIGDYVTIDYGDQTRECMVTAYFQTMNQLGEIVRLHETAPTDFTHIASAFSYQINFADQPNEEELADRIARIKALFDTEKVFDQTAYCVDCIGVVDTMEAVQWLLLAITIVVVMLVTILMERSFIADEKTQIAMLKAIGFRDGTIVCWQVCRFGLAALIAVILAAVLSIPMTKLCITPIFGMMGASRIKYNIDVLQIFVLYPGAILFVTVVVAWLTALYTRTIKSSDTANIE